MKLRHAAIAAIFTTAMSGAASAAVVDFDAATDCTAPGITITPSVACFIGNSPGSSDAMAVSGDPLTRIRVDFDTLVRDVSVDLGDFGMDPDRFFLSAFDAGGNLIALTTLDVPDSDVGMHTLSLAMTNVAHVVFGTTGVLGSGGFYADNLSFTGTSVVPLPAAAGLLLAGLGGLVVLRRRKRA